MTSIHNFVDACRHAAKKHRIAVVGDTIIDQYFDVHIDRISPEFPIPVMKSASAGPKQSMPGGATNVCRQLEFLGFHPHLISFLDEPSLEVLTDYNINVDFSIIADRSDGLQVPVKQRFYHGDTPFCRRDIETENYGLKPTDLAILQQELFRQYADSEDDADLLILSDYNKGLFNGHDNRSCWISLGRQMGGATTIIDPKSQPVAGWSGCSVFKPNTTEAAKLSGETGHKAQADYFRKTLKCTSVVITHAGDGVSGWDVDHGFFEYRNPTILPPRSVIGAGDCFTAFLSLGYVLGFSIVECAEIAFSAGAAYCQNMHNHPISFYDLMKMEDPVAAKHMMPPANCGKMVLCNGCFDILHTGHIQLLQFAKSQGDCLVVAVNDDASTSRLKGDSRPINPLDDRLKMLASLEVVDFVTSFAEDTPLECIKRLKPAVLVKGSEYTEEQIVGTNLVSEVHRFPMVAGISTSKILEKI